MTLRNVDVYRPSSCAPPQIVRSEVYRLSDPKVRLTQSSVLHVQSVRSRLSFCSVNPYFLFVKFKQGCSKSNYYSHFIYFTFTILPENLEACPLYTV
jgi:hypothetical protein